MGGGANEGFGGSSSASSSPFTSLWLGSEVSVRGESALGRSLSSSWAKSSVVLLIRGPGLGSNGGASDAAGLIGGALAWIGREVVEGGAREGREGLCEIEDVAPGSVDVLRPAVLVLGGARLSLGLAGGPAAGLVLPGGVLVLDVDALEFPLLYSCFVGDFAGLCTPPPCLAPGVGLPDIALALLPGASVAACLRKPFTP
jgi:hypothetical protein